MAINVDFEEIRGNADDLRQEAEDIREIITNCKSILEELNGNGFEGQTAQGFDDKFIESEKDLEQAAELIDSFADSLDTSEDNFEEMDQEMASKIGE